MAKKKECPVCGGELKDNVCTACGAVVVDEGIEEPEVSTAEEASVEEQEVERSETGAFSQELQKPAEHVEEKKEEQKKGVEFDISQLPLPDILAEQQALSEKQRNFIRKMEFDEHAINIVPTFVDKIFTRKPFRERAGYLRYFSNIDFMLALTGYAFLFFILAYLLGFLYMLYTPNNFLLLHIDTISLAYTIALAGVFVLSLIRGRTEIRSADKSKHKFLLLTAVGVFLLYFIPLCENFYIIAVSEWLLRLGLYIAFGVAGAVLIALSLHKFPVPQNYRVNYLSTLFLFIALIGGGIAFKQFLIAQAGGAPPAVPMTYGSYLHFGLIDFYLLGVVGVNLFIDYRKIMGKRNLIELWLKMDISSAYESIVHMNYSLALRYCLRAENYVYNYVREQMQIEGKTPTDTLVLNTAKREFPMCARLKLLKAFAYYKLERYDDAEFEVYHVLDVQPNNAGAWLLYGNILHAKNEDEHAIKCYANGIKVNPGMPELWNNMGNLYLLMRKFKEAELCYIRATTLNRNYREAYANRSYLYLKQEKYDRALIYADMAMGIKPAKAKKGRKSKGKK